MHVKPELTATLRTFASYDMAVGKVEDFLGHALDNHEHDIHWLILPVPVAPDSKENRYVPVFFSINEKSKWLARTIAGHGWPFYG